MKNKKGAIAVDVPIELIALLFSAGVLLVLFIPQLYTWITTSTEQVVCEWSIVAGAIARPLGKELISPECKARKVSISTKNLQQFLGEAETTINKWLKDEKYVAIRDQFPEANLQNKYKYALNKLVAREMTNCWEKVLRGKLPMFDEWYNKIDLFGSDYPEYAEKYIDKVNAFVKIWGAPTFCIICSNIKFEDDLASLNLPKNIDLTKWLQHMPYKKSSKSIYEYLYEGQTKPSQLTEIEYNYDLTPPNRYSVVYERINPHVIGEFIDEIWDFIDYLSPFKDEKGNVPRVISRLRLVPHSLVAKPKNEGGESCFYIIE